MPKFSEVFSGNKAKTKKLTLLDKDQEELKRLIDEGLKSGTGPLADVFGKFNEEEFNKGVSDPAMKNFKENILPQILEKFTANNQSLGTGSQAAQLKAGTDLQSQLAQLMYQAQQAQKQNKIQGVQTSLGTKAFENLHRPRTPGAIEGFVQGLAKSGGETLGKGGGGGDSGAAGAAAAITG